MLLPTFLAAIPNHRRSQGRRMVWLGHLLLFSILAILSDATSYRKIQRFIAARLSQLNALCGVHWKRAPAHTAIRHILRGLNPAAVEVAFRSHAAMLAP
ncbi:MAG: transposase family protein [Candidatus Competibacter sp.]